MARLRRALGTDLVDTVPGGYRLAVDRRDVDALRAESLVDAARGLDPGAGSHPARRGDGAPARTGAGGRPPVALRRSGRRPARASCTRPPSSCPPRPRWRLGEPAAELDALAALLAAEPLRESTAAVLARCLHAAGRQVEALTVLDRTRDRLADELGVDPGPDLSAARLAVLRGSPAPRSAPAPLTSFVGRTADVRRITGLLATGRLVTLTGPGGAGKTRLAREIVRARPGREPDRRAGPARRRGPAGVDRAGRRQHRPEIVARIPVEADTDHPAAHRARGPRARCSCSTTASTSSTPPRTSCRRCWSAARGLQVLATSREPLAVPGEVLHPVDAARRRRRRAPVRRAGAPLCVPGFAVTAAVRARRRRDLPAPRRTAAADRAGRRPAAHAHARGDPPPGSTTGSACSPPGREPRCRATRRCAPSSTGAGICSTSRSARWPGGCRSSRAARPKRPRLRVCGLGDATLDAAHRAGREVAAGRRAAGKPDPLPDAGDDPRVRRAAARRGGRAAGDGGGAHRTDRRAGRDRGALAPAGGAAGVGGPAAGRGGRRRRRVPARCRGGRRGDGAPARGRLRLVLVDPRAVHGGDGSSRGDRRPRRPRAARDRRAVHRLPGDGGRRGRRLHHGVGPGSPTRSGSRRTCRRRAGTPSCSS